MKTTKVTKFIISLNEARERLASYQKNMIMEMLPSACNPQELAERIHPLLGTKEERREAFEKKQICYIETPMSISEWVICFETFSFVFLNPSDAEALDKAITEKKDNENVEVWFAGRQVDLDKIQF